MRTLHALVPPLVLVAVGAVGAAAAPKHAKPASPKQAAPKSKPAAKKPAPPQAAKQAAPAKPKTDEPPCAPKNADAPLLAAAGGKVVACWREDGAPDACFELSRAAAPRRLPDAPPVPPPAAGPPTPPAASVREEGGRLAACAGATCRPIGMTVRAAIAKARALGDGDYTTPHVTGDLRLLVIENELFSIADDRRVRLRPPADLPLQPAAPRFAGVALAGDLAIASWSTCPGRCLVAAAVDGKGASLSRSFPGGAPIALDDRRVAILPIEARATVTVLDRATGVPLGSAALHDGTSPGMLGIAADPQTIVALEAAPEQAGWEIFWVTASDAPPAVTARQGLPSCPSP